MHVHSDADFLDQHSLESSRSLAFWLSLQRHRAVRHGPLVQPEKVAITDQGIRGDVAGEEIVDYLSEIRVIYLPLTYRLFRETNASNAPM